MRVLKFRAWNKQKKKWMWPYPDGFHIIGETTVFELLKQDCTSIEEYNDLVIVQYTGVETKGVEIYEGNILRATGNHNKESNVFQVTMPNHMLMPEVYNYEIIGNIFENPELIK